MKTTCRIQSSAAQSSESNAFMTSASAQSQKSDVYDNTELEIARDVTTTERFPMPEVFFVTFRAQGKISNGPYGQ